MPNLNGNYIDFIIILFLLYFASEAFRHGFWVILADFLTFLSSLFLSLRFYKYSADFLRLNFNLSLSVSNALGFLISAVLIESLLGFLFGYLIHLLPKKIKNHKFNKLLGIISGLGEGVVLISFLLTLIVALPIKPKIKSDVVDSKIGSVLIEKTANVENAVNQIFGDVIKDSLTYFTIHPESGEVVKLEDIETLNLSIDEKSESEMLIKINKEREKLAIIPLIWNSGIVPVARDHATDMWERRYFSHISPEGNDVGDRLSRLEINYQIVGENLALAPTVATAHTGLMNSKGHRENILNPDFKKVGIGVIDNGIYGEMFVQVFTD